jgi:hypothetical protein
MEIINEACILNLIASSIFSAPKRPPVEFDWNDIAGLVPVLDGKYHHEDARLLLQMSLMVTNSNMEDKPLNAPSWLRDVPASYSSCPLKNIGVATPNPRSHEPGIVAHMLYSERLDVLFIVFTGTSNACLVGLDIEYDQDYVSDLFSYENGMKAHRGIYAAYMSVRQQVLDHIHSYGSKRPQIVVTGHSLGGALANLCGLDMAHYQPLVYSFAAPQIFNQKAFEVYSRVVNNSYRVANLSDLVVLAPLPVMPNGDCYYHVGELIHFQRNLGDFSLNHSLGYVEQFEIPIYLVK